MSADILREIAKRLRGRRIPGGCDECNAYQTLEEDPDLPGCFRIRISHDHWCAFIARIEVN